MSEFRLLVLEDEEEDLTTCRETVQRYVDQKGRAIKLVECIDRNVALEELDKSFDGAIIDLTLFERDDEGNPIIEDNDAGNQIVKKIAKSFFRIPIAILTGDPSNWDTNLNEKSCSLAFFQNVRLDMTKS